MLIGIKIALKYFNTKHKSFLFIGIAIFGTYFHYIPVVVNVIYTFWTSELLPVEFNLLVGFSLIPIIQILLYLGFSEMIFKKNRKIMIFLITCWGIIFSIILFYFTLTDASVLASVINPVKMKFEIIFIILTFLALIFFIIPFFIFSIDALRSNDPEVKLKGKFLIIGAILYPMGSIFDIVSEDIILFVLIARIMGIISSIAIYLGMILPERIKKKVSQ